MVRTLVLCFGRTPSFAQALWFHEGFLAKRTVVHSLTYHLSCIIIILVWHSKIQLWYSNVCGTQAEGSNCIKPHVNENKLTTIDYPPLHACGLWFLNCIRLGLSLIELLQQENAIRLKSGRYWIETAVFQSVVLFAPLTINPLLSFYPMIIAVEKWSVPKYDAAS